MAVKNLWKTTIVIWSEFDPQVVEIDYLAREAMQGSAICTKQEAERVPEPENDPDWDGNDFFYDEEDET